jgi:ABC-type nitrate/sulfonate/bicarbonate transport system permease component
LPEIGRRDSTVAEAGEGMDVPRRARRLGRLERPLLGAASIVLIVTAYALAAAMYARPAIVPPPGDIAAAAVSLLTGRPAAEGEGHHHSTDHIGELLREDASLSRAITISALRVTFGIGIGGALGLLFGVVMGWSRTVDQYLHPLYVLVRSVPPLALITYVMLWLGHGQAHLLVPIAYAVATTVVIPAYHGVRDVADVYVQAARALGARPRLILSRVVVPAVSPFVLSGLRYAVVIAWMTTVGVEMLMSDDGLGHLLVGGGLWSSRLSVRVDPSVVIVGILAVAVGGYVMDSIVRLLGRRFVAWAGAARW